MTCNVTGASVPAPQTNYTFTAAPGILYYVAVRSVSDSGRSPYTAEVSFSVPSLNTIADLNSTVGIGLQFDPAVTDPDGSPRTFSATNLPLGLTINGTTGRISGTPTATGTYRPTIIVSDALGSDSEEFTWTIGDGALPLLAVTSHSNGQSVTSPNITLSGTATDNGAGGSGIASVTVNGQPATGGTAAGNGTANWSRVLTLAAGSNALTIRAEDGLGNARTVTLALTLAAGSSDTMQPVLAVTSHTNGQTVTTSSITLSGTASDSGLGNSGIARVLVNGQPASGGTAAGSGTAYWSRALTLVAGSNTLTVRAEDGLGNARTVTLPLTYSAGPHQTGGPMSGITLTTSLASPQAPGTTVVLQAAGSGGSGSYAYRFGIQPAGGGLQLVQNWSPTNVYSWRPTVTGDYELIVQGRNLSSSGGAETSVSRMFRVQAGTLPPPQPGDTTSPALTVTSHASGQTVTSNTITLRGVASDSGTGNSGIASVTVNGQAAAGGSTSGSGLANWSRAVTLAPGANLITVAAVDGAGNTRTTQLTVTLSASTNPNAPITSVSISPNVTGPRPIGTPVTFTATVVGGSAPHQFRWFVRINGSDWLETQAWSTASSFTFVPTVESTYDVLVWVRNAGYTLNQAQATARYSNMVSTR